MFEFIETKRHTVESVYGRPERVMLANVDAAGYEAIEFRVPVFRDLVAAIDLPIPFEIYCNGGSEPRLILRRKTVKRRVLTETGEVRYPLDGDWYEDSYSRVVQAKPGGGAYAYKHPIYRETFVEVEL